MKFNTLYWNDQTYVSLAQDKEYGENSTKYFLEFRKEKLHQETHKKALIQRQGA